MKRYRFVITFKRRSFIEIDIISQLMLFVAIALFMYAAFNNKMLVIQNTFICGLIILWWLYCMFLRKKNYLPYYRTALLFAAAGFILQPQHNFILIILYAIAVVFEKQVKFAEEVGVDEDGITLNSFPKKKYEWKEISNMIIKDGLLTIDFRTNRLMQKEVEEDISPQIEIEFNNYCVKKIKDYHL